MSYYDDSSLFLSPNGYKTSVLFAQKPMDANGQLAFTRSNDTATRVGPDGLIEKVRTNLVLQSETFDNASWNKTTDGQVTITANAAAAPDGTTTAEKMIPSAIAGFHCCAQTITLSAGEVTISVFAKAAENSFLQIFDSLTTDFANFNLTTGAVGSTDAYVASIQSAGNGWFRCTATKVVPSGSFTLRYGVVTTATAVRGQSFTGNGTDGLLIWGAQAETGVATDYIATTTAAVSVGPVANVPRIDYTGGGCGKLLLEPQRTNLITFSEQINDSSWTQFSTTVTANAQISPDGYQNADVLSIDGSASRVSKTLSLGAGTYSVSVYAKAITGSGTARIVVVFDAVSSSFVFTPTTSWERYTFIFTAVTSVTNIQLRSQGYIGNLSFWGCQLEVGSYASSYVNTLGAAVTRGADACVKTGISSLIGQTEGTLFVEGAFAGIDPANTRRIVSLSDGTTSNSVLIQNTSNSTTMQFVIVTLGTTQVTITKSLAITFGQTFKAAFAYKENDFVAYINGEQVGIDILGTVPACSKFAFDRGNATTAHEGTINEALLFKTRLSNSELAQLTTI